MSTEPKRPAPGERLYRLLLLLHPPAFRGRYRSELVDCYRDAWRAEAAGRGVAAALDFWRRTAIGTLATVWRQRQDRHSAPRGRAAASDAWLQDLRLGVRALLRRPGWTAVVIATLGLGMGATLGTYSVFRGVLLAPLPYPDADRLVRVYQRNVVNGSEGLSLSAPASVELREQAASLESVAILEREDRRGALLTGGDRPERIEALRVNASYFATFGARFLVGRPFERHEESREAHLAVVSERLWNGYLGGSASGLGRSVLLDGEPYSVIGVLESGYRDPGAGAVDVWLPSHLLDAAESTWDNNYLSGYALLREGISLADARAELDVISDRHADMEPAAAEKRYQIVPLREDLVGSVRALLLALMGAVAFLLLLTCTNVAGLMLARAATREQEFAIRTTLGSGRGHLVRYAVLEACVLALAAGVVGLVVGSVATEALVAAAPADLPLRESVAWGGWSPLLAAGLAVAVGLSLGVATALPFSRPRLASALAEGGRAGQGGTVARRAQSVLVVTEVALAVVLLVGAGVLLRTVNALRAQDLGVDPEGVVAFEVHLPEASYSEAEVRARFQLALQERLAAIPGASHAGATSHLPVTGSANTWGTWRAIAVGETAESENLQGNQRIAGGDYFQAVGARLLAGRFLDERDGPDAPRTVVVNASIARAFYPDEDPVGQLLRVGPFYPTIVGVVDDIALGARTGSAPMVFHAYPQFGAGRRWPMTQVVRFEPIDADPWAAIRAAVADVDPGLVVHAPRRLTDVIGADIAEERFAAMLLQAFAALALVLASLGLYGVLSHSVQRRRHEIGVRMALGADRGEVLGMVVRRGLVLTGAGTVLGGTGAIAMSGALGFLVFGVAGNDPLVLLGVTAVLGAVALASSYLPALRATKVEPVDSLQAR